MSNFGLIKICIYQNLRKFNKQKIFLLIHKKFFEIWDHRTKFKVNFAYKRKIKGKT